MAGFANAKQLADAQDAGNYLYASFRKQATQTTGAGVWFDLSMSPGNPAPNYYIGSPGVFVPLKQSTDGGLRHGGNVSPSRKFLRKLSAQCATAAATPLSMKLLDYIGFYGFIDESVLDEQFLDSTAPLPRYTDGAGVQAFVTPSTVMGAGTPSIRLTYTDSAANAGNLTPATLPIGNTAAPVTQIVYSGTGNGKFGPFMPLAAGDSGIRSVQQFNLSATYTSGVLNLVLCKPLLTLPITTLGVTAERDLVNQFMSMPKVYDGACLAWLMLAGAATPVASPLSGHLEFGWS